MIATIFLSIAMLPAYFTGNQQPFTTVTGQPAIRCEYRMGDGRKFWKAFAGYNCPQVVEYY